MAKKLFKNLLFVVILIALLLSANHIVLRKSDPDLQCISGIQNEPKNSFDVMFFGTSRAYCTANPLAIWDKSGIPSYVFSSEQQPLSATYYYIKEALKHQSPKLICVEMLATTYDEGLPEETVVHDAVDYFPNSFNKIALIKSLSSFSNLKNYIFPGLKYHSRWREITNNDFDFDCFNQTDFYRGYRFYSEKNEVVAKTINYDGIAPVPIHESKIFYLHKIIELAKENNIKLLFFVAPYDASNEAIAYYKSIKNFANAENVDFIDFNILLDEIGLAGKSGYYLDNYSHLNCYGSDLVADYFAKYFQEHFDLENKKDDPKYSNWNIDVKKYYDKIK